MIYKTTGVCASEIHFDVQDNQLKNLSFIGGCNGNLKAISNLLDGEHIDLVITKLKGNTCGPRPTSCTDQLAQALTEYKLKQK